MTEEFKPFAHQTQWIEATKDLPAWAYFHETGTGKSMIALEVANHLIATKKIDGLIIIAPKGVYRNVWIREIDRWLNPLDGTMTAYWNPNMTLQQEVGLGKFVDREYQVNLGIFVINVEAFSYKRVQDYVARFIAKYKTMVILDESTRIKNPSANRTKSILSFASLVRYKRILTGFPVLTSPSDLYTQIVFLDRNVLPFNSYTAFRGFYCILKQIDRRVSIEVGYKNLSHLSGLLEKISSRVLKKDCLDLPPKTYEPRYIEMTKKQKELYDKMKREAYIELKNGPTITTANIMNQVGKLLQIANGILLDKGKSFYVENNKYDEVLNFLEYECSSSTGIAANFTSNVQHLLHLIQAKFGANHVAAIFGDTREKLREQYIQNFQEGSIRYLVINPATVREGIDLYRASTCIFFNNSFRLDFRVQFEDRFHRIGQHNPVTYVDFITEGTVEERLIDRLLSRRNLGARIFNEEQWEEWFD